MTIADIITILDARVLCGETMLDSEVKTACGSDLMSDVLAFVKDKSVLITGLTNVACDPHGGDAGHPLHRVRAGARCREKRYWRKRGRLASWC